MKKLLPLLLILTIQPAQAEWEQHHPKLIDDQITISQGSCISMSVPFYGGMPKKSEIEPGKLCHWEIPEPQWRGLVEKDGALTWEKPKEKLVLDVSTSWESHFEQAIFEDKYLGPLEPKIVKGSGGMLPLYSVDGLNLNTLSDIKIMGDIGPSITVDPGTAQYVGEPDGFRMADGKNNQYITIQNGKRVWADLELNKSPKAGDVFRILYTGDGTWRWLNE